MRTRLIAGTASAILIVVGVLAGIWMWMKQPSAEPPVAEMIVLESDPSPVYFPRNSPDWKPFEIETVALLHTLEMKEDCLLFSTPATADHPGYLVVWPPDYRLHSGPDGVEVQGDTFIGRPRRQGESGTFGGERTGHPFRRPGKMRRLRALSHMEGDKRDGAIAHCPGATNGDPSHYVK